MKSNTLKSKLLLGFLPLLSLVSLAYCEEPTLLVDEQWDSLSAWNLSSTGLKEISPAGQLHLSSTNSALASVNQYLPVPSTYTLETRLKVDDFGSSIVVAAYDGLNRLYANFTASGIYIKNANNSMQLMHSCDTNWHTYRFEADNGSVELFIDNVSAGTSTLNANTSSNQLQFFVQDATLAECHVDWVTLLGPPTVPVGVILDENWNSLSNWNLAGVGTCEINPLGQLHLLSSGSSSIQANHSATIPGTYSLDTDVKIDSFGTENGLAVYDGACRLHVYFTSSGVKIRNAANSLVSMHPCDTNWHNYRFDVSNGTVHLYVDAMDSGTTSLNANTSGDLLEYWVKGAATAEMHVGATVLYTGSYSFNDSFTGYSDGANPDYWMESGLLDAWNYTGDEWTVKDLGGNKVYYANCLQKNDSRTLLHVHGRDVAFESKVQVNSYNAASGALTFIVRGNNSDSSRITAQYTFSDQQWRLIEQDSASASVYTRATSGVAPLPAGWNLVHVDVSGSTVSLTVNGSPVISASNFVHDSWGRVGLQAKYVDAYFDDVAYTGDGRAEKGVGESSFQRNCYGSDMVKLSNGKIIMDQNAVYESSDGGATWAKLVKSDTLYKWTSYNMITLANGNLLAIQNYWHDPATNTDWGYTWPPDNNKYTMVNRAFISSDNGVSWQGPFQIQPTFKYRITMPNKLSQAANGRIFFASGEETNAPPATDGVWIYYSDDGGQTWTQSATFPRGLEEGKVVGISGNTVKAFFRTRLGALYESTSTDNGVHWSPTTPTSLVSPLCSFNVERDPATGYYYMVWEYEDIGLYPDQTWPRSRVSLAVSYDNTATWKFLMDLDDQTNVYYNLHFNHSLRVIDGNVWCQVPTYYLTTPATDTYIRVYKAKTTDINPYVVFPALH